LSDKVLPFTISPRDAQEAMALGLEARKRGSERAALPLLKRAAAANPRHAGLWQVLGLCYRAVDQLGPALEAFAKAAALAPTDALIAHGHARVAMEAGLPAIQLFDAALRLAPLDGAVMIGRSAAQLAEGDLKAAVADLDAVLALSPAWYEGHSAVARLRWIMGQERSFTASLDHALGSSPADANLWSQLVLLRMQARQFSDALDVIGRARRTIGVDDALLLIEACCLAELERTDEADRKFEIMGDVDNAMVVEYKVRHALRLGRIDQAEQICSRSAAGPLAGLISPYQSIVWRLQNDPRSQRLEQNPGLVSIYDIAAQLPPQNQLVDVLTALHHTHHSPLEQSLRGGSQTDGPLFSRINPVIQSIRSAVLGAVTQHIASISQTAKVPLHPSPELRFAGSWSVLLHGSGHHANHVHQAGWLSSALYIALPEQQQMGPAPAGWLTFGEPPIELKTGLAPIRMIEPKFGQLVLFPSTLWHGTRPIAGGTRLTVAFDIAPPALPLMDL